MIIRHELARQSALKFAALLSVIALSAAAHPAAGQVTFVKTYADVIRNTAQQKFMGPYGVQATSDGGQVTAVQFKFAITASGLADTR